LTVAMAMAMAMVGGPNVACAQDEPLRSTVVIVGDADRLNIGQQGYCGQRTEIDTGARQSFSIPAGKRTHFFVRSYIKTPTASYVCEGDYAFIPEAGLLHIIRFAMVEGDKCRLEIFRSLPGGVPMRMPVFVEPGQLCVGQSLAGDR
jgi:hypothetical protein